MTDQQVAAKGWGRRGMFAGAAAVVAAAIGKLATPERAQAGHSTNIAYDSQTVMHLDVTNTTAGSSRISSNISGTASAVVLNNYPVGISRPDGLLGRTMYTTSNCAGVAGTCENTTGGIGVQGAAKSATGVGVYGFAGSVVPSTVGPSGTGVYGAGPTQGVYGTSPSGAGVGVVGLTANNIGVIGQGTGSGTGVFGASFNGTAIFGQSTNSISVHGLSVDNIGVQGDSTTFMGVYGNSTSGYGVFGRSATGTAGHFDGTVAVVGAFTVIGGPKSAGVRHTDGSLRRMYCQEAPEPWFEDFGRGAVEDGKATDITLDPDFVAVIKEDYDVFLTPNGDSKGLFVSKKESGRFAVQEQQGGTAKVMFSYRVVARRREDVGTRLEKITLKQPQIKATTAPTAPKLPPVPPIENSPVRTPGDLSDDRVN